MRQINRERFEPLYHQVARTIRDLIDSGALHVGDRVWSERELMDKFKVSRNTVRRALAGLARDGLVYSIQGLGTFVAPSKMRHGLSRLSGFSEDMISLGLKPSSRLLARQLVPAPPRVAKYLALDPGQQVIYVERLRLADGKPMAINSSYVPYHLCPELLHDDLETDSLFRLLEGKYGMRLCRAEEILRAAVANDYEAKLLGVARYTPLLLAEGTTFLEGDVPIEYMKILYRGDRYEFVIHMTREGPVQVTREVEP